MRRTIANSILAALLLACIPLLAHAKCNPVPPAPNVDWAGCAFAGQFLGTHNLTGANLKGTVFNYAVLDGTNFRGANLTNASLLAASLKHTNFEGANLTDANLKDAHLDGAKLDGAKLDGAKLDGATWTNGKKCAPGSIGVCK